MLHITRNTCADKYEAYTVDHCSGDKTYLTDCSGEVRQWETSCEAIAWASANGYDVA